MAEEIIGKLKRCEEGCLYPCVVAHELLTIREEISRLPYSEFKKVLDYARNSTLPPDFRDEMEVEYLIRNIRRAR